MRIGIVRIESSQDRKTYVKLVRSYRRHRQYNRIPLLRQNIKDQLTFSHDLRSSKCRLVDLKSKKDRENDAGCEPNCFGKKFDNR